jgi:hypothetical protein
MAKSIKPMFAVFGPGGMLALSLERTHAEDLAKQNASKNLGIPYYVLGAVAAFVADPPVVRTVVLQGSDAPAPAPEPEDIIDYMEAKAAVAATSAANDWIEWFGADNPVRGKTVQYRMGGDGPEAALVGEADRLVWHWRNGGRRADITAYRVVRS